MPEWWIGRKHTAETREKMRLAHQGKKNHFYGKKHSDESKQKNRQSHLGKMTGDKNHLFGKQRPQEVRDKISKTRKALGHARGAKNGNWHGGIVRESRSIFRCPKYGTWRDEVFKRDNYTCQHCGHRGGDLEADHIKPWAFFPDLRFDIKNGRTLCLRCHKKTFKEIRKWRDSAERRQHATQARPTRDGVLRAAQEVDRPREAPSAGHRGAHEQVHPTRAEPQHAAVQDDGD